MPRSRMPAASDFCLPASPPRPPLTEPGLGRDQLRAKLGDAPEPLFCNLAMMVLVQAIVDAREGGDKLRGEALDFLHTTGAALAADALDLDPDAWREALRDRLEAMPTTKQIFRPPTPKRQRRKRAA